MEQSTGEPLLEILCYTVLYYTNFIVCNATRHTIPTTLYFTIRYCTKLCQGVNRAPLIPSRVHVDVHVDGLYGSRSKCKRISIRASEYTSVELALHP